MPTDDSVIFLETVALEYLTGSAPRISIRATVQRDGSIGGACCLYAWPCMPCCKWRTEAFSHAVEVNKRPYLWRSLEMLAVTMDQGWHYGADWPGLPRQVSSAVAHARQMRRSLCRLPRRPRLQPVPLCRARR